MKQMKRMHLAALVLALLLMILPSLQLVGCAMPVEAENLMDGVVRADVHGTEPDETFRLASMQFSLQLLQQVEKESEGGGVLVSPLSVLTALAMTANGARGATEQEMRAVLGGLSADALNGYLLGYMERLAADETKALTLANSIWFSDDYRFEPSLPFLQKNADYYGADLFRRPFDNRALDDINNWISKKTDGAIPKMLNELSKDAVMVLINALVFDAKWDAPYAESAVSDGIFTDADGKEAKVEMMSGSEYFYLHDASATGFIKLYETGRYAFAAMLPNEGIALSDYVAGLTAEGWLTMLDEAESKAVVATMPKFDISASLTLNDSLAALGMPLAFDRDRADFSGLGHDAEGNIYINRVIHKTTLSVDEKGTRGAAATVVEMMRETSAAEPITVTLDRPFIASVYDRLTGTVLFFAAVTHID